MARMAPRWSLGQTQLFKKGRKSLIILFQSRCAKIFVRCVSVTTRFAILYVACLKGTISKLLGLVFYCLCFRLIEPILIACGAPGSSTLIPMYWKKGQLVPQCLVRASGVPAWVMTAPFPQQERCSLRLVVGGGSSGNLFLHPLRLTWPGSLVDWAVHSPATLLPLPFFPGCPAVMREDSAPSVPTLSLPGFSVGPQLLMPHPPVSLLLVGSVTISPAPGSCYAMTLWHCVTASTTK